MDFKLLNVFLRYAMLYFQYIHPLSYSFAAYTAKKGKSDEIIERILQFWMFSMLLSFFFSVMSFISLNNYVLFVTIAVLIYAQCNEFKGSQTLYNLVVKRVMELYEAFGSNKVDNVLLAIKGKCSEIIGKVIPGMIKKTMTSLVSRSIEKSNNDISEYQKERAEKEDVMSSIQQEN